MQPAVLANRAAGSWAEARLAVQKTTGHPTVKLNYGEDHENDHSVRRKGSVRLGRNVPSESTANICMAPSLNRAFFESERHTFAKVSGFDA